MKKTRDTRNPLIILDTIYKQYPLRAGYFSRKDAFVHAVNGVSLSIHEGETYGIVGESGCGKTTTARLIVGMEKLTKGEIYYNISEGVKHKEFALRSISRQDLRQLRSSIRYVFQDPIRSLNPRLTIRNILLSGYRYSPLWRGSKRAEAEACAVLKAVGLQPGDMERKPPHFSGGQRQRIAIARALITKPRVLICDEVVSALDSSIQGQILSLLLQLQKERKLTMIFISHDLAVVSFVSDRIGVMYKGILVEEAPAHSLIRGVQHPYTKHLFHALPILGKPLQKKTGLFSHGDVTQQVLTDESLLTMDEVSPGHRISRAFTTSAH